MSRAGETSGAIVVGSGPNGLAAAVTLAQAGVSVTVLEGADEIGGGTRTAELSVPGLRHDICSAVHPLALQSPFFTGLDLTPFGLEWRWPEIDLAHPLDDGTAAVLTRSLEETVAGLGADGPMWRRVFGPLVDHFDELADDVLGPVLGVPEHPVLMARFGLRAGPPAAALARLFRLEATRALFAGNAAHVIRPLDRPATSAAGVLLIAAGHRGGWPVAAGGSASITSALAALLESLGGTIETGVTVRSLADLPPTRMTLFDTSPTSLAAIAGDQLPARVARAYRRWEYGPGVFKVDLAVAGDIPWTAPAARRAGTVHLGGTLGEIAAAERDVTRGRMPTRPFVLVAQQYLADPTRSAGGINPVWAYAHVPSGYDADATGSVLDQIERFAPGARERIVATDVAGPAAFARYNPNYVGGDIACGANTLRQLVVRPRPTTHPYATGIPGVYLCSSATPPGAGVHGMCGYHAARAALADLEISDRSGPRP